MERHFTVDDANRTLPLVRRIVEDVVRQHRVWREKILELDLVASSSRADEPPGPSERPGLSVPPMPNSNDAQPTESEPLESWNPFRAPVDGSVTLNAGEPERDDAEALIQKGMKSSALANWM